jgi:hypothetical protein
MGNGASDFIDLVSSGDEAKIKCVLLPTLGGALASGVMFAETGPGAGIAAVLGGLLSYAAAYRLCGAGETRGGFNNLFSMNSLPRSVIDGYETSLVKNYGVTAEQARYVTKSALVYLRSGGSMPLARGSMIEERNGIHLLLRNAGLLS